MGINTSFISNKNSKEVINESPKLPLATDLADGEIAVNFAKDYDYAFIKGDINRFSVYKNEISFNKLFKSKFKTERKKIDWGKILSMEIGGKKKKA